MEFGGAVESPHLGVGVNGSKSLPGSALVDELHDLISDGQRGRRAEGGQLLFLLLLHLIRREKIRSRISNEQSTTLITLHYLFFQLGAKLIFQANIAESECFAIFRHLASRLHLLSI